MNPFEMTVLIVAIVATAKVLSARFRADRHQEATAPVADPDAARMRDEIRNLRERIAVLERIATDDDHGRDLEREIEALRGRD